MLLLQILRLLRHAEIFDVGRRGECLEPEFAHFTGNQRLIAQYADAQRTVDIVRYILDQTVTDTEVEVELAQGIRVMAVKSTLTQVIDPKAAKPAND